MGERCEVRQFLRYAMRTLGPATLGVVTFGLALAAEAREVKFPKDQPRVSLTVPDDWTVAETAIGLELTSPEKNAYVVANLVTQNKTAVDSWSKEAGDKLKAFGIKFDDKATPPPAAKAPPPELGGAVTQSLGKPAENFTFSGAPTLTDPAGNQGNTKPVTNSLEALTGLGPSGQNDKPPFKVALYGGTSLNNKPVDVQLVIFRLKKQFFVMDQESGPDDSRTVAIVQSVRTVR